MKLSLYARPAAEIGSAALRTLASRGYRGVDLLLSDCNPLLAASLADHNLKLAVRIPTRPPSGLDTPSRHVEQVERGLAEAARLGASLVRHVLIEVDAPGWQYEEALKYASGALPPTLCMESDLK